MFTIRGRPNLTYFLKSGFLLHISSKGTLCNCFKRSEKEEEDDSW
jgi:hypothetical protein